MTDSSMLNNFQNAITKLPLWIIEDEPAQANVLQHSLTKRGYACKSFYSGNEFITHLKTWDKNDDNVIMLLDYLLGDMNARELLAEMKKLDIQIPFVIMTAHGDEKIAVQLMRMGAMDYVIKDKLFVNQITKVVQQVHERIDTKRKLDQSRHELKLQADELKSLNKQINHQKLQLEKEKIKTDKLLHSILPHEIALELMEKGYSTPKEYQSVSILFADVIGFSDLAKKSHPIALITQLDNYFYVFDEIVEQHGLEKIKTIGDCYMCAGGIPTENVNNAIITVLAGLKIQDATKNLKYDSIKNLPGFRLRLGIHTGEVVAGVVGKNKFAYDIWGDAVNVASRIVETGEKDKVNISESTYEIIKDYFILTERGEVMTKRNIPIKMYFVERLKPEFSADARGLSPGRSLLQKLNIRQGIKYY